jgi:hypothetical protein
MPSSGHDPFYTKVAKRRWNSAIKRKNSTAWKFGVT